jgi:IMP dehydrogenase
MPLSFHHRFIDSSPLELDDIALAPLAHSKSATAPSLATSLTKDIHAPLPFLHVTSNVEHAIHAAQHGYLAVIPATSKPSHQVDLVRKVKRFQSHIIDSPLTVTSETSIAEAMDLQLRYGISGIPVIDATSRELVGIISKRDLGKTSDITQPVTTIMSTDLITMPHDSDLSKALNLMTERNVERIILTDKKRCVGMITRKDIDKIQQFPKALTDSHKRLRIAAHIDCGQDNLDRIGMLIDEHIDVIIVDNPYLRTRELCDTVTHIRRQRAGHVEVIAGPVYTVDAAMAAMDAGANAIFMRPTLPDDMTACGIDFLFLHSLGEIIDACSVQNIPVHVDGLTKVDQIIKTLAIGANGVITSVEQPDLLEPIQTQIIKAMQILGYDSLSTMASHARFVVMDD